MIIVGGGSTLLMDLESLPFALVVLDESGKDKRTLPGAPMWSCGDSRQANWLHRNHQHWLWDECAGSEVHPGANLVSAAHPCLLLSLYTRCVAFPGVSASLLFP